MTNFTNVDKKLLNEVFISILDKEPVKSVCQWLGVSINFYNSYRTIIFDVLKNVTASFDYPFTGFLDYINDVYCSYPDFQLNGMICEYIWKVIHQNNLERYLPEKTVI